MFELIVVEVFFIINGMIMPTSAPADSFGSILYHFLPPRGLAQQRPGFLGILNGFFGDCFFLHFSARGSPNHLGVAAFFMICYAIINTLQYPKLFCALKKKNHQRFSLYLRFYTGLIIIVYSVRVRVLFRKTK